MDHKPVASEDDVHVTCPVQSTPPPTFDIYPHISPVILRPAVQGDGEIVDHPFVEVTESVHPALSAVNHHVGQRRRIRNL